MRVADTPYLVDLAGVPSRAFSRDASWELEDRADSTNRLTLDTTLADAADVLTDMEVLFRRRRFTITDVNRVRSGRTSTVIADESQVELGDRTRASFHLKQALLSAALAKAVEGTLWSAGTVADDTGTYYSDLEHKSVLECLRFLQAQSGLRLHFDSAARIVSLVTPTSDDEPDRLLTYAAGVSGIEKDSAPPQATVLTPVGRDGMTIESVNGGKKYVEDFSWYEGLGLDEQTARDRFTREYYWSDDRYIYQANLLRDAQRLLARMSQGQLSYKVTVLPEAATGLRLGDRAWVVDHDLDVTVATTVSRVLTSSDPTKNEVELDYLKPSLGADVTQTVGDGGDTQSDEVYFQAKNQAPVTIDTHPGIVLSMAVATYADTAFQIGVTLRIQTTTAGDIDGWFLLNGNRLDVEILQTTSEGWTTIGLPFLVTQIPAGNVTLDLYMTHTGTGTVPALGAEIYLATRSAYGGIRNERPDRSISEHIPDWTSIHVTDTTTVTFEPLLRSPVSEAITFSPTFTVTDSVSVSMLPTLSVDGAVLTIAGAPPDETYTVEVAGTVAGQITVSPQGTLTVDLETEYGLLPGTYECVLVETGQQFTITVPGEVPSSEEETTDDA